jgi:hypothetical protein
MDVRRELEKMRHWAEARLKAGAVPDESWQHHVQLIEALDAVLHDVAVAEGASRSSFHLARPGTQHAANDPSPYPTMRRRSGTLA